MEVYQLKVHDRKYLVVQLSMIMINILTKKANLWKSKTHFKRRCVRWFYCNPWEKFTIGTRYLSRRILFKNTTFSKLFTDERWKKSRRILNPSFHVQVLNSYMDNFNERSLECAQSFEEAIKANNGEEFDIFPILNLCTLKTICGDFY